MWVNIGGWGYGVDWWMVNRWWIKWQINMNKYAHKWVDEWVDLYNM